MTAEFKTRGAHIGPADIARLEAQLPKRLPEDYHDFLLTQNGGDVHLWWPPETRGPDFTVAIFYSLGEAPSYASLTATRLDYQDRIPEEMLAIAGDPGGAEFCLSLRDEDYGAIWLYDPESEFDPDEPPDAELWTPITDTFTGFVDTLEPEPGFEETERRLRAVNPELREINLGPARSPEISADS